MPAHRGIAGLALHHFTRGEALRLLRVVGFDAAVVRAVTLRPDGRLTAPLWFGGLRAYGYLLAAKKPRCKEASHLAKSRVRT